MDTKSQPEPKFIYVLPVSVDIRKPFVQIYELIGETEKHWKVNEFGTTLLKPKDKTKAFLGVGSLIEYLVTKRKAALNQAKYDVRILSEEMHVFTYNVPTTQQKLAPFEV